LELAPGLLDHVAGTVGMTPLTYGYVIPIHTTVTKPPVFITLFVDVVLDLIENRQ